MNKHKENNRARRICAKLKTLFHTIRSYEERIAAVQFNEELDAEEKASLVARLQNDQKHHQSKRITLEKRQKELAYTDVDPVAAFRTGATHFATHTTIIPERASDSCRRVQVTRKQCKCSRAFFAVADCYAAA